MNQDRLPGTPKGNYPDKIRQSLAVGFRQVDTSGDTGACHQCLDLIAGIPFFHAIKTDSFRIIASGRPDCILDAGCGNGSDLASLASLLPRHCRVTGLDASKSLLARAAELTKDTEGRVQLIRGDVTSVPCKDAVFDACRIDRVLQHLEAPEGCIQELTRITRPGGMLVAFDNDWETFSISLNDADIAERIRRFWCSSFASGRIGKDLPEILRECGIIDIHTEPRILRLNDLSLAERVFDLPHLLGRMGVAGIITPAEVAEVRHELADRAGTGSFASGYTGFLVTGHTPE
jgi:SAM-dependent methyltransferase